MLNNEPEFLLNDSGITSRNLYRWCDIEEIIWVYHYPDRKIPAFHELQIILKKQGKALPRNKHSFSLFNKNPEAKTNISIYVSNLDLNVVDLKYLIFDECHKHLIQASEVEIM